MKKMILTMFLILHSYAADNTRTLSTELRGLLSQEMNYIKNGMNLMLNAIIANDFEELGEIAKKIEHSYILKQKLTSQQKQEIREKLSKKFIEYDQEFHSTAQELASFAEFEDRENVLQSYSSMINQCVRCHENFATHRFTNFESN